MEPSGDSSSSRTYFEHTPVAVFVTDGSGRVLDANRRARELVRHSRGTLADTSLSALFDGPADGGMTPLFERVLETGSAETRRQVRRPEKPPMDVSLEAVAIDGDRILVAARELGDGTADEHIRDLTERFELAVEGANLGIWDWDLQTDAMACNERWAEMLDLSRTDLDGRITDWTDRLHPDDEGPVLAAFEAHVAGETAYYETEYRLRTATGAWKWIRNVGKVVDRTPDGRPLRAVGIHQDIDERKRAERTLQAQRDNLEVLNQIVRHDIRNDLQLVVAYGELLSERVDADATRYLEKMLHAARNAVQITETAKTVADVLLQADAPLTRIDLRPVLTSAIETAQSNHGQAVITVERPLPDCVVRADDLLGSVFRNLLQNAVLHSDRDVPSVTVSTRETGSSVAIEIADDGPGVPDAEKERIFEEGVRGLESEGTGLGLYIVETLVERYGGEISIRDNEPRGAVFTVELPLAEATPAR